MGGWRWRGQGLLQVSTALICPGKCPVGLCAASALRGALCSVLPWGCRERLSAGVLQRSMQHTVCSLSAHCRAATTQLYCSH